MDSVTKTMESTRHEPDATTVSMASRKPHCVLGFRWILAWLHLLYYLTDRDVALAPYHLWVDAVVKHEDPIQLENDLVQAVFDFYDYFVTRQQIQHVVESCWDDMLTEYGSSPMRPHLPLASLITRLSLRDQQIFRTLTLDVYSMNADPVLAKELGLET